MAVANSAEAMERIEACLRVWIKQIEQVLAESDQLRKEADDLGPRAELDHWKKRMSRFNYLLDQLKSPDSWKELDTRITDSANEAKDNVKYLYTLEKFCDPLYNSDPVTNQMITACKAYITSSGSVTIWDQPPEQVVERLTAAIHLNQTKEKLEQTPSERQFDFSEMYIFGKFDTFQRRLAKILELFATVATYSALQDSKIEGLETVTTRFQTIVQSMKNKHYSFLDQRRTDFDVDYEEFCQSTAELHVNLGVEEKYQHILQNYSRDIEMVSRTYTKQKLDPPIGRDLPPVAGRIMWSRQLIIRNYNRVARVLLEYEMLYHHGWMQQMDGARLGLQASLLVRSPETGELFVNFDPEILTQIREADRMSRMRLELMLSESCRVRSKIQGAFEHLVMPHVAKVDEAIQPGLTSLTWTSLNIDKYLDRINAALGDLELLMDRVNDLVEFRIDAVLQEMSATPLCVLPDGEPFTCDEFVQITRDLCIKGAQSLHTKSSLVEEAANELINMLLEFDGGPREEEEDEDEDEEGGEEKAQRRDGGAGETEAGDHVDADGEEEDSRSDHRLFSRNTLAPPTTGGGAAAAVATPSPASPPVRGGRRRKKRDLMEVMEEEAQELLSHFNHRNPPQRGPARRPGHLPRQRHPVHPSVAMVPAAWTRWQQALNRAVECVVSASKGVGQWGKERISKKKMSERRMAALKPESSESASDDDDDAATHRSLADGSVSDISACVVRSLPFQAKNYYKGVSENKEIVKLVSVLGTSINSNKKEVVSAVERFARYHHIWRQDREDTIHKFSQGTPLLSEFESRILSYRDLETEINGEPEYITVGALALYTADLKMSLTAETKSWVAQYGLHCNRKYRSEMEHIFAFVDEAGKKLNRQIKDLDDIRIAMAALKEIRERQISMDFQVGPIEESYAMLHKYEQPVAKEEVEKVDTLRYTWEKLLARGTEVQNQLAALQPDFRGELIGNVETFLEDCHTFYQDYDQDGPMAVGLAPQDASDRLIMFQNRFDNLFRKYVTYTGGEELFGLPVTQHPQLLEIRKQLTLLQKLYGLYNSVIDTVNGYYDVLEACDVSLMVISYAATTLTPPTSAVNPNNGSVFFPSPGRLNGKVPLSRKIIP
ncbi:hypothetical protein CRUP_029774 [Coryphaenoides rupestris]|nr:hypothetical protein CRUP_029774 [Coryphaenoides rupestris]